MQGTVQLFLISVINKITMENQRPRDFLCQQNSLVDYQAAELLSGSLGLGVPKPPSRGAHSVLSCKMGTVTLRGADRMVVRFLFENKIILDGKYSK